MNRVLSASIAAALGLLGASAPQAALLSVPTDATAASPTFGAKEFRSRVILLEEFVTKPYSDVEAPASNTLPLPETVQLSANPAEDLDVCRGTPRGSDLDDVLKMDQLYPLPGVQADYRKDANGAFLHANPWSDVITGCLPDLQGKSLPMDGRPPEGDFMHQRWDDFKPAVFFQSVMAGARVSGGARDGRNPDGSYSGLDQSHKYGQNLALGKFSEFGKDGLYHNTVTSPYAKGGPLAGATSPGLLTEDAESTYVKVFEGTTKGIPPNLNPESILNANPSDDWPDQKPNSLWTFDGTAPLKLLMARYGEPILFRHHNALPIINDQASANGFGTHTITTHAHNLHNPAESDGFAGAWFYPGQFYDYHWPLALAGHDSINTLARDKRAAMPCTPGETIGGKTCLTADTTAQLSEKDLGVDLNNNNVIESDIRTVVTGLKGTVPVPGDYRETQSTLWFHDHMEDFTAQNVYKGNAAMMNIYSAVDRGNESVNDGVNLKLPSGSGREWGNRDYDVNLVVADKAFDATGQLWFNPFNKTGFLGDRMTVNLAYKPYMDVRARRYRFRILNGSVSRYLQIAVVDENGLPIPYYMIANDGNILQHSLLFGANDSVKVGTTTYALTKTVSNAGTKDANSQSALPVQSIAERYDIVIDFARTLTTTDINKQPRYANAVYDAKGNFVRWKKIYFLNLMEHTQADGPKAPVTVQQAWNAFVDKKLGYNGADTAIGKFMEFRIRPCLAGTPIYDGTKAAGGKCKDDSMSPGEYVPKLNAATAGKVMLPLPTFTQAELKAAKHRTFVYGKLPDILTDGTANPKPWALEVDGQGGLLNANLARVSAAPATVAKGSSATSPVEIWHLNGNAGGWGHPGHIHFEEGQIISRNNAPPPVWEQYARKDMYRIGPELNSSNDIAIAIRVREYAGTYVQHCHNTQHEDNAMLLRWDAEKTGPNGTHLSTVRTPHPFWDGVHYAVNDERDPLTNEPVGSTKVPTADTGSTTTTQAKSFVLPATWGLKASDVPANSAPPK